MHILNLLNKNLNVDKIFCNYYHFIEFLNKINEYTIIKYLDTGNAITNPDLLKTMLNLIGLRNTKIKVEPFNKSFTESILNAYLFEDIMQVQILAEEWVKDYNSKRPHEAFDVKTPSEYRAQWSLNMELALRS